MSRTRIVGKDRAGNAVTVWVKPPGHKDHEISRLAYHAKVAELIREGADKSDRLLLRSEVEGYLRKMGLWTQEDEVQFAKTQNEIREKEVRLRKGGMKLSEARIVALKMGDLRAKLLNLYAKRAQLDSATIESVAENHRFNVLASRCIVGDDGQPYFRDVQEYLDRADEEITVKAATALARIVHGFDEKFAENLFETQWLKKYGFMNDDGRLTDRNGNLVDREGRRVNAMGRFVDEKGELIDLYGNRVDENGELIIEAQPFIDDETGEPVSDKPAPKRRGRKKRVA